MDASVLIYCVTISKNCPASHLGIEAVSTVNKNRRGSHIVVIVPFNLISCGVVDSKKRAIS